MKQSLLTILRDKQTSIEDFRKAVHQLGQILASEIALHLKEKIVSVQTPFKKTQGHIPAEKVIFIPILRSGLALLFPFLECFETAKVGVLGIKREEKTAIPIQYYSKLPPITSSDLVIILDPMIATGGTAKMAINLLLDQGAKESQIHFIGLVAAKSSLRMLKTLFPQVTFHIVAPDESLSKDFWITPGLGDFGDRFFGS